MKTRIFLYVFLLKATLILAAENIVKNGGFEHIDSQSGAPADWNFCVINTEGNFSSDDKLKCSGKYSLRTFNKKNKGWIRSQQFLPVKANSLYTFSLSAKGNSKAIVRVSGYKSNAKDVAKFMRSKKKSLIKEWTLYYGYLKKKDWVKISDKLLLPPECSWVQVDLINAGKGKLCFDDVEIIGEEMKTEIIFNTNDMRKNAPWRELGFFRKLGSGKCMEKTSAWIKIDKEFFYVKIKAKDERSKTELLKRNSNVKKEAIYWGDTLELFVSPENSVKSYFHFSVNPCGISAAEEKKDMLGLIHSWHDSTKDIFKFQGTWESQIVFSEKEWIALLKIPLKELKKPQTGDVWKIALCRGSTLPREYSSWPKLNKSFHEPQNFAKLIFDKEIKDKEVNLTVKNFNNGPEKPPKSVKSEDMPKSKNLSLSKPHLIPQPQKISWKNKTILLSNIIINSCERSKKIAKMLKTYLQENVKDIEADQSPRSTFKIFLELSEETPDKINKIETNSYSKSKESYFIKVSEKEALLKAKTPRGLFYALQTFKQLISKRKGKCYMHCTDIIDWPNFELRGMHLCLRVIDKSELLKLIKMFGELKLNTIFLENAYSFKYKKHPECISKSYFENYSCDDIKEILDEAKRYCIDIIPGQPTLTHCRFMFKAHPELREGGPGSGNYCPSNEKTYELVFEMMDELIDAYKPKQLFFNHDEAQAGEMCVCEKCKGKEAHQLFANDIIKIHDYLKDKKIKSMIFGDQLSDKNGGPPFYNKKALPLLPKDIVIVDWNYGTEEEFPSSKMFMDNGFELIGMAWDKPVNIYNYSSYLAKLKAYGFSGSVWWGAWDMRQWIAYILLAEFAWSPEKPLLSNVKYRPLDVYLEKMDLKPKTIKAKDFFLFDISPACNSLMKDESGNELFGLGPDFDFGSIPCGVNRFNGAPFNIDENNKNCMILCKEKLMRHLEYPDASPEIKINKKLKGLAFLHASGKPEKTIHSQTKEKIAKLTVNYTDGTKECKIFNYRTELIDWNSPWHTPETFFAWEGNTRKGARILLAYYAWNNPYPEKMIKSIQLESVNSEIPYILFALTGF